MRAGAVLVVALVACAGPDPPAATCNLRFSDVGDVRAFVFGHAQRVSDNATYDDYDRAWRRHAMEVKPCLSTSRPNLLVFPEHAGLGATLLGGRGAVARRAPDSTGAFLAAAVAYLPGIAFYAERFPAASTARLLLLAASDPAWRATRRTFGGMAKELRAWVLTSANVADVEESRDPDALLRVRDPGAPWRDPAYVARTEDVFNTAVLFDPDGEVAGRVDKVFLVHDEEETLDLSSGSLAGLRVLSTPFGRIGVATSRDAFYAPFMQRLEDLGADLVVQPEAFSGWTIASTRDDEWHPDVFLSSGWLHTQRHRSFRHSLAPQLTGNFFDMVFDGQVHITRRARPDDVPMAYVGGDARPGFQAIGRWVMADPPGSLDERRARLRDRGDAMKPGSTSVQREDYVDSVVAADLLLPDARRAAPVPVTRDATRPASAPLAPGTTAHQRHVDLASDGSSFVVAAWQEDVDGRPVVRVATSSDGGQQWAEPLVPEESWLDQRKPAVCVGPGRGFLVAWQQGAPGRERIHAWRSGLSAGITVEDAGPQWDVDCGFTDAAAWLVWTDLRDGAPHVRAASWTAAARSPAASVPVDAPPSDAKRLDGAQAQPSISPTGGHVAWVDHRGGSWDVRYARVEGARFTASIRVDGADSLAERLHSDPVVVADTRRQVWVAFTDLHSRRAVSDIGWVMSTDGGRTFGPHRAVPGGPDEQRSGLHGGAGLPRFRPSLVVTAQGPVVFFQDLAASRSVIMAGPPEQLPVRVDDTGTAPLVLTRPRAAALASGTLVAWEDDREGPDRIYAARLPSR